MDYIPQLPFLVEREQPHKRRKILQNMGLRGAVSVLTQREKGSSPLVACALLKGRLEVTERGTERCQVRLGRSKLI